MDELILRTLIAEGRSQREIAELLGKSQTNVRYWLAKLGLCSTRNLKESRTCFQCDKPLTRSDRRFCSCACSARFKQLKYFHSDQCSHRTLKLVLIRERGHKCEVCTISSWCGEPAPIEIDHIDGNANNNDVSNVRLICPNCHAQTPTYKSKNRGRGRSVRRQK